MKYSREQVREVYKTMPDAVKDVLGSVENAEVMAEIGKKHHLHIDQQGALVDQITLLVLGLTKPDVFYGELSRELNIPQATAEEISVEVNEKIFQPLREMLREALEAPSKTASEIQSSEDAGSDNLTPPDIGYAQFELPKQEAPKAASDGGEENGEASTESEPGARDKKTQADSAMPAKVPGDADFERRQEKHTGLSEAKLSGSVKLPKEERVESDASERPDGAKGDPEPQKPQYPGGNDPYRELPM